MNQKTRNIKLIFFLTICLQYGAYSQKFPKLESKLLINLSADSIKDGRWVFDSSSIAGIEKIIKPNVSKVIPNYAFYKVRLTNYLGYHINQSNCLILFDEDKSKILLVQPMWYSDISSDFLRLFIGIKFNDSKSLMSFLPELRELMVIGSSSKFDDLIYTDTKVTFNEIDMVRGQKQIFRNLEIVIDNNMIISFKCTNPVTK